MNDLDERLDDILTMGRTRAKAEAKKLIADRERAARISELELVNDNRIMYVGTIKAHIRSRLAWLRSGRTA